MPLLFPLISLFPLLSIACIQTFENPIPVQLNNPAFPVKVTKPNTKAKKIPYLSIKEKAYKVLREKGIWTRNDFANKRPFDPELQRIPSNPYKHYKGWSWLDARFLPKEEAYKLLRRKGILTLEDFLWERPTDPELQRIHSHPYMYYKGWSWPEVRGEEKVEFLKTKEEAYELLQTKDILSKRDFERRRAFDQELQQIPRSPDKYKPYKGWSWLDAYGEKHKIFQLPERKVHQQIH